MNLMKKNNLLIVISIFIVGLIIVFTVTNPKKSDYISWAKERSVNVEDKTLTNNYLFFSVFQTKSDNYELKVLGILGNYKILKSNGDQQILSSKLKVADIEAPSDLDINKVLPNGGWTIEKKEILQFPNQTNYLVVGASYKSYKTNYQDDKVGQIFILKYNSNKKENNLYPLLVIWQSPELISGGPTNIEVIRSINKIITPKTALVVANVNRGGAKGLCRALALTINQNGEVQIQKDIDIGWGTIELKKDKIIVTGEQDTGVHAMSLQNGNFVDKVLSRSQMSKEGSIKAKFILGSNKVIASSNSTISVKVGDTVSFEPQDDNTRNLFDTGKIDLYQDALAEATRVKVGNSITFTSTGVYKVFLTYGSDDFGLNEPEPTFTVTVTP